MNSKLHKNGKLIVLSIIVCMICVSILSFHTMNVTAANGMTYDRQDYNMDEENTYELSNNGEGKIKTSCVFFEDSYLVELSWNLVDKANRDEDSDCWIKENYTTSKKLTLKDKTTVEVFYASSCKKELNDSNLDMALLDIFQSIKDNSWFGRFPLTSPLVRNVRKINTSEYKKEAKELYANGNALSWYSLYQKLDNKTKEYYRNLIIKDDKRAFLNCIVDDMSDKQVEEFFKSSYKQKRLGCLSVALDYISDKLLKEYAQKAYDDNYFQCFKLFYDELDSKDIDKYIEKSFKDNRLSYFEELMDDMDCEQFDKYIEKSFNENKFSFFKELLDDADDKTIWQYYKKAIKEKNDAIIKFLEDYIDEYM